MAQLDLKQIGLWVFIWLVGYGLGLLEAAVKEKNRKKKEKPEVVQLPPQLIEEDYALALFEEDEQLTLKLDKAELKNRQELNDTQRKRLISLVVGLRPWLEGSPLQAQPSAPKPQAAAPASQPTNRPVTPPASPPPAPAISTESKTESQSSTIIEHTAEEIEYASLTMVQQIDWLLQKKLVGHPLKAKRIRLQGALTGGVEFFIGNQRYEYIDEIEDLAIRELFQQAIKEWEEKTTPGL